MPLMYQVQDHQTSDHAIALQSSRHPIYSILLYSISPIVSVMQVSVVESVVLPHYSTTIQ